MQAKYFIWCSTKVVVICSSAGEEMPVLNGLMSPSAFRGGLIQCCTYGGL